MSFFVARMSFVGVTDTDFTASWDGKTLFTAPGSLFPYTQFSFVVPGHGHDTLEFAGNRTLDSFFLLDDVVVTPVPEPSTLSLFGLGLLLGGALLWRKKKLYSVVQA